VSIVERKTNMEVLGRVDESRTRYHSQKKEELDGAFDEM